jgi:hypothetical protein
MRSIALRVGIIGAIAGGAWILRPFIMGNAGSLAVGDCFDPPAAEVQTVEDVQHHPCNEAHGGEVVFVGNYAPAGEAYPSDDEFMDFVGSNCIPAFNTYTGLNYDTATDLDVSVFTPTTDGWGDGDRKVICYAVKVDGSQFTGSVKAGTTQ